MVNDLLEDATLAAGFGDGDDVEFFLTSHGMTLEDFGVPELLVFTTKLIS
jgi:hypothetical protein